MADIKQIAEKIKGAENILVALSKNPNVDEVSAAMGLTLMLDKIGKKATAIYSGETPDVLKFLNPEKTFSTDTNALQDFIIALDKEKADHIRYKVDGDFVKVFITPYHEAISENDLEYSYGDFNVDLIVALDVAEEGELDAALVEYGRIMHDAGVVNITTREGGKFSEAEWANPGASSVSEMVAELGAEVSDEAFEKNSATALLTGIVASTERFANEKTTPETMGIAAKLMKAGADQRLIAENIERAEEGKEPIMMAEEKVEEPVVEEPKEEVKPEAPEEEPEPEEEPQKPILETPSELVEEPEAKTEEPVEEKEDGPVAEEPKAEETTEPEAKLEAEAETKSEAEAETESEPEAETPEIKLSGSGKPAEEKVEDTGRRSVNLQPSAEAQAELEEMLKEAPKKNELLDELNNYSGEQAATGGLKPDVGLSAIDTDNIGKTETKDYSQMMAAALDGDGGLPNPAVQAAPAVMAGPEANHIPEMDYSQGSSAEVEQPPVMTNGVLGAAATEAPAGAAQEGMTATTENAGATEPGMVAASEGMNDEILPPPPAPPVDGGIMPPGVIPNVPAAQPVAPAPIETASTAAPVTPVIPAMPEAPAAPETPAQVGPAPTNDDPAAFRIPGM